mgnify:CR=1 FL=1
MRKKLRQARLDKGMTQKQVAEYLEIGERRYQDIEYGKTLGSIKHWDALEDLFQIPQRQLRQDTPLDKSRNQP